MGFNSGFKGLIKTEFSRHILEKYSYINFDEHQSSGSQVSPCRRTDIQTDMANITDAFSSFADASNKITLLTT